MTATVKTTPEGGGADNAHILRMILGGIGIATMNVIYTFDPRYTPTAEALRVCKHPSATYDVVCAALGMLA